MGKNSLHITNGDSTTKRLMELEWVQGSFLIWREMLCEGPTVKKVDQKESIEVRKQFLKKYYKISGGDYDSKFISELQKLEDLSAFDEIILWFEYDLFCQINMIAALSLLLRKNTENIPVYLVCSGKIKNEDRLIGLSELTDKQLMDHYFRKKLLSLDDIEYADYIWTLYCESDPKKITGQIKRGSNFEYLSISLRAHLQRFPNMLTGLNVLEHNILEMINSYQIKNLEQLMGYALEYQGYYGYGDMQMKRVIARLFQFLDQTPDQLTLSERGKLALEYRKNFYNTQELDWQYGGVKKYDYLYNNETHLLLKLQ